MLSGQGIIIRYIKETGCVSIYRLHQSLNQGLLFFRYQTKITNDVIPKGKECKQKSFIKLLNKFNIYKAQKIYYRPASPNLKIRDSSRQNIFISNQVIPIFLHTVIDKRNYRQKKFKNSIY